MEGGGAPLHPPPSTLHPQFKSGDRVRHSQFGEGIVINCIPRQGDAEVTVIFKGPAGQKRLLLSLARLERV
ncbi:MAG: hypothetical protein HYX94_05625 [Chloroflexi bacterium]|nr:hypothetical protein [Chloroflexota bacterium]